MTLRYVVTSPADLAEEILQHARARRATADAASSKGQRALFEASAEAYEHAASIVAATTFDPKGNGSC